MQKFICSRCKEEMENAKLSIHNNGFGIESNQPQKPKSRGEELDELFEASIAQAVEGIGKRWPELKKDPITKRDEDSGIRYQAYKDLIRAIVTGIGGIEFFTQLLYIPKKLADNNTKWNVGWVHYRH